MKKNILPVLTLAASLTLLPCFQSCTKTDDPEKDPEQQKDPEPEDDGKPKAGDYTFTVSPLKGKWEAGDQILVHGSYAPSAETFTLKASDISSDGKTATVKLGDKLFEYLAAPDNLYAAWPASAVKPEDGLMDATTSFSVANILLAQAYLEGTNFQFDDASAAITFSVTGGYDRVLIAGAQRPGLRFTQYSNEHSSSMTSFARVATDGYPFREEPLAGDGKTTTFWFPGGVTLKGGFTLYFGKDGTWPVTYTYDSEEGFKNGTLKAGNVLALGDITAKLAAYDGPAPKMPEMVKHTKYAVKFNELSGICVDPSGDFLLCLGDGSEIAKVSVAGDLLETTDLYTFDSEKEIAYTIDSEGLSVNYDTGDLLISGEPNVVCRIPSADLASLFSWEFHAKKVGSKTVDGTVKGYNGVKSLFNIADASGFGNSGAEGCTYYKDGLVYIGTQTGSYLYLCNLETGEVLWRKGLREMHTVITEIAGLCYDPLTDWLWVIDSESHKFFALTGDGEKLLGTYALKTKSNEESICVDHKNHCVWVGDDYGSTSYIYKYEFTGLDDAIIQGE